MKNYKLIFISVFLIFLTLSAVNAEENITTNTTVENIEPSISEKISDYNYTVFIPEGDQTSFEGGMEVRDLPEDASGNISMAIDGVETYNKYVSPLANQYTIDTSKLSFGNHTALIKYTGDEKYFGFVKNTTFNYVPVLFDVPDEVEIESYEKNSIKIYVADGVTGNIKILIDGKTFYNRPIERDEYDDFAVFYIPVNLEELSYKKHTYKITYSKGNQKSITKSGAFNVSYLFNIDNDDKNDIVYGESVYFSITLPEIAKSNLIIKVNNKKYTEKLSYGYGQITLSDFKIGENIITFTYKDKNLPEKTVTKIINVQANLTAPESVEYNDNQKIILNVPGSSSGTLTVKINNETRAAEIVNGTASVPLNNLNPGKYDVEIYSEYKNYSYTLTVTPNLSLNSKIYKDEIYNLTFKAPENFNGVLQLTGMLNKNVSIVNGSAVVQISGFKSGEYQLNAEYIENNTIIYSWKLNTAVLSENPNWNMEINFPSEVSFNDYYDGFIVKNTVDNLEGEFKVYIDNVLLDTINSIYDDYFQISFEKLSLGKHTLTLEYCGDDYYKPVNKSKTFDVKKVLIELNYNNDSVIVNVPDNDKGTITVNIDGKKYKTQKITPDDYNDRYEIELSKYTKQNIEVIYSGKYGKITKKFNNIIPKYTFSIDCDYHEYLEKDKTAYLNVPIDITKNIILSIDGVNSSISVKNMEDGGLILIKIPNLAPGIHKITATYPGDKKYPKTSVSGTFEIGTTVQAPFVIYQFENAFANLTLPNDGEGNFSLFIKDQNGEYKLYNSTKLEKGFGQIPLPSSELGKYEYKTTFVGNYEVDDYKEEIDVRMNIQYPYKVIWGSDKNITVKTHNITDGYLVIQTYDDQDIYSIRFNGSELNISFKNFDIGDYSEGLYRVQLFENGKYVTSEELDFYVKPIPAKLIGGKNINMYYSDSKTYSVKIWGDYGKVVGKGETVTIKIGKNTFKIKTDKNGVAKLKIPAKITAGKYTIKATYHGVSVKNTLNVKNVVTLKKVKVKKYAKKLTLKATLKKGKVAIKKAKVTFKFKGKKYTAKTNSKGVAKVTIKKSVLKKLKVGKKVTYQVTYKNQVVKKTAKVKW